MGKTGNLKDLNAPEKLIHILSLVSVLAIIFIFVFVGIKAWPVIRASGAGLVATAGFDKQVSEAFFAPAEAPVYTFGLLGLIAGTLFTTGLSLLAAAVLGIGAAIAIAELAPKPVASALGAVVRLLASIPSVVFGLVGIIVVVPAVEQAFVTTELQIEYLKYFQITGRSLLASVLVLTFMIVPMVISLSIDALRAVPGSLRETGYAFGMSRFRVIWKIVLPSARSGILAGMILAFGRGIGEAIAVSMVCGGIGNIPDLSMGFVSLLTPVLTLSAAIINKSEAMGAYAVESALFACGALLLLIGAALSIGARLIENRLKRSMGDAD
ncbi:phosphate ABC transporter permease subunit PstC [Papillibacter cinnamivorans]|uniref:Phosphate transport system permease protein n=1 Tax=Papillibacter cinnamivorans DSM 12816 TaxID=1122930 RepID=A0A1W1YNP8_9FIRM|nr:phosphate ABC transporter permease subunit PstC [Papillibacter cinnamivorans]SMC37774.1 phosphate transport system permease protein [Papillibacter cinnamivorans DSM 12816]